MCEPVCALLYLFLCSGCNPQVVASRLAFHPPNPPFYQLHPIEKEASSEEESAIKKLPPYSKEMRFKLAPGVSTMSLRDVKTYVLTSNQQTAIPIFCIRHFAPKYTILFSHGNATDIGAMHLVFIIMATRLQVNVVGYDYSGYGASNSFCSESAKNMDISPLKTTVTTEKQTYYDIMKVFEWCKESMLVNHPEHEVILYGQSVGSGPSCYLASKVKVAGLVLHSPIMSGLRVITNSKLLSCFDIYPNIDRIKTVKCPTFIIHGMDDKEVSCIHGQTLHQLVPEKFKTSPWWVPSRGHNDILHRNEENFIMKMQSFLNIVDKHIRENVYETTRQEMERSRPRNVSQSRLELQTIRTSYDHSLHPSPLISTPSVKEKKTFSVSELHDTNELSL